MNSMSLRSECGDLGPALQQTPERQKQRQSFTSLNKIEKPTAVVKPTD